MPPSPGVPKRSLLTFALFLCMSLLPARAHATVTLANWDQAEQRAAVSAGLMHNLGRSFRGAAPLSAAQANAAMSALAARLQNGVPAVQTVQDPVKLTTFD